MKKIYVIITAALFSFFIFMQAWGISIDGNTTDWLDIPASLLARNTAESMCGITDLAVKWSADAAAQTLYFAVSGHAPGEAETPLYGTIFHLNGTEIARFQLPDFLSYDQTNYHFQAFIRDFGTAEGDFFGEYLLQAKTPQAYALLSALSLQAFDKSGELSRSFALPVPVNPPEPSQAVVFSPTQKTTTTKETTEKTTAEKTTTEKTTKTTTTKSTTRTTIPLTILRSSTKKSTAKSTAAQKTTGETTVSLRGTRAAATAGTTKFMPRGAYASAPTAPAAPSAFTSAQPTTPYYFGGAFSGTSRLLQGVLRESSAPDMSALAEPEPDGRKLWGKLLPPFIFFLLAGFAAALYWINRKRPPETPLEKDESPSFPEEDGS